MYPTIVIVLVSTRRSVLDTYGLTNTFKTNELNTEIDGPHPATTGYPSFAIPLTESMIETRSSNLAADGPHGPPMENYG